ncbi:family 43 glycosylhydrolase [Myceligenerans halotolerans]
MFFRPHEAWVGDVIPWESDGTFHLFYLHERRGSAQGTPWHLVSTRDFVTWTDHGEALPSGGPDAVDHNAYTGSVVRDDDGLLHAFYTAQNPRRRGPDGRPLQLVTWATSAGDLTCWTKTAEPVLEAQPGYEPGDWRDPFVFHDPDAGLWRMLLAARREGVPHRRSGVVAQCVSRDLVHWEPAKPLWDPARYLTQECPEVFHWNGWWYLVYSEFTDAFVTRYRMARSLDGPWLAPRLDSMDGRAYYAAKSAARDGRRFFFGWIASKEGSHDDGAWQWAGTLAVLEARQEADGTLSFDLPGELTASFTATDAVRLVEPAHAAARDGGHPTRLEAWDGHATRLSEQDLPVQALVELTLDIAEDTRAAGILLRVSADGEDGYALRLEPDRGRMVLDRWPRPRTGGEQWQVSGDVPHAVELERPCDLPPGTHTVRILLDGDLCVVNLDGRVSLSTRLYDHPRGRLGVFVTDGALDVQAVSLSVRPADAEQRHTDADRTTAAALLP